MDFRRDDLVYCPCWIILSIPQPNALFFVCLFFNFVFYLFFNSLTISCNWLLFIWIGLTFLDYDWLLSAYVSCRLVSDPTWILLFHRTIIILLVYKETLLVHLWYNIIIRPSQKRRLKLRLGKNFRNLYCIWGVTYFESLARMLNLKFTSDIIFMTYNSYVVDQIFSYFFLKQHACLLNWTGGSNT
jgi:hypothetical protein